MEDEIKLSIIIPVFNMERYIIRIINNIISQRDKNIEIIVVDDGSTDDTRNIVLAAEKKNKNIIKYFYQENKGVSSARNFGMKKSRGKYIWFIDGDDTIPENTINRLFDEILNKKGNEEKIEIIQSYYMISKKGKLNKNTNKIGVHLKNDSYNSLSLCSNIICKEYIEENNIEINKNLKYTEDMDCMLELISRSSNIVSVNYPIYIYNKGRVDSATSLITKKRIQDMMFFIDKWEKAKESKYLSKEEINSFISYQYYIVLSMLALYKVRNDDEKKSLKKMIEKKKYLISYCDNKKGKIVRLVYKVFGYNLTCFILGIWLKIK